MTDKQREILCAMLPTQKRIFGRYIRLRANPPNGHVTMYIDNYGYVDYKDFKALLVGGYIHALERTLDGDLFSLTGDGLLEAEPAAQEQYPPRDSVGDSEC